MLRPGALGEEWWWDGEEEKGLDGAWKAIFFTQVTLRQVKEKTNQNKTDSELHVEFGLNYRIGAHYRGLMSAGGGG